MALTTLPERPQEQTEKPDPVETLKKSFSDRIKGLLTENTVVQTIKGYWNRISSLFSSSKTEKTSAPETKEVTSPIESLQQSVQEQVKETLPNPFKQAEKLEKQHVDQMAQQFGRLMNEYRESSAKIEQPTDFIPLRKPQLTENDELSQLAAQIADGFAKGQEMDHTSTTFQTDHKIHGEILTQGFRTAEEALAFFIESQEDVKIHHRRILLGDYTDTGYAIRSGVDPKNGQTLYYLVVLFRGDKKSKWQPSLPSERNRVFIDPDLAYTDSIENAVATRPILAEYFQALKTEQESTHPDVQIAINAKRTENNMIPGQRERGSFWVTFTKDGKNFDYLVWDAPPVFLRLEGKGKEEKQEKKEKKEKEVSVPFSKVLNDVDQQLAKRNQTLASIPEGLSMEDAEELNSPPAH